MLRKIIQFTKSDVKADVFRIIKEIAINFQF